MLYLSAQIKIIGREGRPQGGHLLFALLPKPRYSNVLFHRFISTLFSLFHNQCEVFRVQSSCMFNTTDAAKWTGVELQLPC